MTVALRVDSKRAPLASDGDVHGAIHRDRSPAKPPLNMNGVEYAFGNRPVLKGFTLALLPGTITWVGGPNGVGKTTMLRIAAGILMPHHGFVTANGLSPARHRRRYQRQVGLVSAGDRGLYARLTVAQNLDFWAGINFLPRRERVERVGGVIEAFGLTDLADRRVDRISMGQRQRVRLAMAFLPEPNIILLDEPNTSLDADGLGCLAHALDQVVSRGGAALWCSPSDDVIPIPSDARYQLEDGKVIEP